MLTLLIDIFCSPDENINNDLSNDYSFHRKSSMFHMSYSTYFYHTLSVW